MAQKNLCVDRKPFSKVNYFMRKEITLILPVNLWGGFLFVCGFFWFLFFRFGVFLIICFIYVTVWESQKLFHFLI